MMCLKTRLSLLGEVRNLDTSVFCCSLLKSQLKDPHPTSAPSNSSSLHATSEISGLRGTGRLGCSQLKSLL